MPVAGKFALSVAAVAHTVWSIPANAVVGTTSWLTLKVAEDEGQTPFVMVHSNTLVPVLKPETPVLAEDEEVILPVPETRLQLPVPIEGTFAEIVVLFEQIF